VPGAAAVHLPGAAACAPCGCGSAPQARLRWRWRAGPVGARR